MTVRQSLARGAVWSLAALGMNALVQFGTVALFSYFWGGRLFAEWLVLFSVPGLFMNLLGALPVPLAVAMGQKIALGQEVEARDILRSSFSFLVLLGVALAAAGILAGWILPIGEWLRFEEFEPRTLAFMLGGNLAFATTTIAFALLNAVHRLTGHSFLIDQYFIASLAAVFGVQAAALPLGVRPSLLPWLMCLATILVAIPMVASLRRRFSWFRIWTPRPTFAWLRQVASPLAGEAVGGLTLLASLQLVTAALSVLFGPIVAAQFATHRTLARLLDQATNAPGRVASPQLSLAATQDNSRRFRKIAWTTQAATVGIALVGAPLLWLLAPAFYPVWTGRQYAFDPSLFLIFLAAMVLNALWCTVPAILGAVNLQARLRLAHLLVTFGIVIAAVALRLPPTQFALALVLLEVVMIPLAVRESLSRLDAFGRDPSPRSP